MIAVIAKLSYEPAVASRFFGWQSRFSAAAAASPGFVSLEFMPLVASLLDWRLVLQFATPEQLARFRTSPAYQALVQEGQSFLVGEKGRWLEEAAADFHAFGSVAEVISTQVAPGLESQFRRWTTTIQHAQATFPGYRGTYIQAPSAEQAHWTTLVRFATAAELDAWLASPERRKLIAEGAAVSSWHSHRMPDAFAGWFEAGDGKPSPPAWKQSMVVLLALFPVVVVELRFLSPLLAGLNSALATFIGNALSVAALSWLLVPPLIRALGWWLTPKADSPRWTGAAGIALMVGLYGAEIILLSYLL